MVVAGITKVEIDISEKDIARCLIRWISDHTSGFSICIDDYWVENGKLYERFEGENNDIVKEITDDVSIIKMYETALFLNNLDVSLGGI